MSEIAQPAALLAAVSLPDAPGISSSASISAVSEMAGTAYVAQSSPLQPSLAKTAEVPTPPPSHTDKYIQPGEIAPKLNARDKFLLGVKDAVSPFSAVGWLASAGYEQVTNGSPNYGTDRGAFGQRLGAAALRDISEGVFSDSILSPVLHEDPRYYRMGPSRNFIVRLVYAGTRPIISKTDGGRLTPNFALIGGNLAGSALTPAYYPAPNRNFTQVMETMGGSMGGSALGDVVSEFYADVVGIFRHK